MSSETPSFTEEVSSTMLKELQSWWEIPSIAQYVSLFREPFNLPEIEIEELENGFIEDTTNGPSEWLQKLVFAFLKSIMPGRINQENWYEHLKRHIRRKWPEFPFCDKENPFPLERDQDTLFHQLPLRSKVEIVYCCCLSRLDKNDIMEQMKSMDAEALRVQKLGMDDAGNTYWYFYGTRLYKEEFNDEKKSWDEEWKEQKRKSFQKKKRGRGRPRRQTVSNEGSDSETSHNDSRNGFMNVSEKSRWSVVCDTIEEWVNFAEKFKNSKSKSEKSLFTIIQENFLPTLNNIYEEKERKLQQKIKELMPTREKIVTRRETRRLRGEDVIYSPANGYGSDEGYRTHVIKDRARRLEERNKRAIEAESVQVIGHKKARHDRSSSDNESSFQISEHDGTDLQTQMERILSSVKLHKDAWPFLYPVNEEDAPGYYEIIKDPVDLSKIEQKLFDGEYDSIGDLDADFKKMVSNCELYNGEYHAYSKMAQALRKMFRKEIAKVLDSLQAAENACADSEGSSDSQYHSSSNNSSPPYESHSSSKEHKPKSGHKKKRKASEALDLLHKASDIAVQNTNSNDMLNVSNIYDEQKNSNDFPSLKILPIHSHPPSFIEKYSSNTSHESHSESDGNYEAGTSYQASDVNGHPRSSPPSDSAISTSSETTNYMRNLSSHLATFIEKDKNLNLLSNCDVSRVLSDGSRNNSSPGSESSHNSREPMSSDSLHGFDNILEEYPENLISQIIKQPPYNMTSQVMAQNKDNCSPPYPGSMPEQEMKNSSFRHSSPESMHLLQDNASLQYDLGSSSNITTVDASVLGITLNPVPRKAGNANAPVPQNQVRESTVPKFTSSANLKNNHPLRQRHQSPPNELSQYYESSNVNYNQVVNNYQPLNMDVSNSRTNIPTTYIQSLSTSTSSVPIHIPSTYPMDVTNSRTSIPTAFIQSPATTSASNVPIHVPAAYRANVTNSRTNIPMTFNQSLAMSTSNVPVHIPAAYPKSDSQQVQNGPMPTALPQYNNHLMFFPESNKGQAVTYHVYSQYKDDQNAFQQVNYHANASASTLPMAANGDKRTLNQESHANRTSPQQKSPNPPETQSTSYVPSMNMPCHPVSSTSLTTTKQSLPVASSNFVPVNNSTSEVAKNPKPVIVFTSKAPESVTRTSPTQNMATSSFSSNNSIPATNAVTTVQQNTVPLVISGFNNSNASITNQMKKTSPTVVTTMSNVCMPNRMPVMQQVLIPTGSQQILQNNGQYLFTASPSNAVKVINKEQNMQIQTAVRPLNQTFGKVVPQIVNPAPIQVQIAKNGNLQFQTLAPTNNQTFTQVTQSPQFLNIPYMLTNQSSPQQSVINLQPYQLSPRQMQISGSGNG